MNRRGFLTGMLKAGVAAAFLPGAGRLWKRSEDIWVPNPEYVNAPYEVCFLMYGDTIKTFPYPKRYKLIGSVLREVEPLVRQD